MAHTGGTRFKVLYDYDATTPHELTIKAGQTVFVTEELDKGWNRGYIGDQYGMFPAAYAEADTSSYGPPSAPLPAAPGASNPPVGAGSNSSGAETAVVTEDFPAKDSSQLALVTGQLVVILRKFPTGWASGESQGKTGMFPLKNVRIVDINEAAALRAESGPAPTGPAPAVATKKAGNKEKRMSRIRSNTLSALSRDEFDPADATSEGTTATVLFQYTAVDKGQISLIAGETITVLDKLGGGWWKGRTEDGDVGFFPGSYVREQASSGVPASGSLSSRDSTANGSSNSSANASATSKRSSTVSKPSLKRATALFKYTAKSSSELSFDVGDEVLVFPVKDGESAGWWTGALASAPTVVAHFPAAYVKLSGGTMDDTLAARSSTSAALMTVKDDSKSNKRKSQPAQRSTAVTTAKESGGSSSGPSSAASTLRGVSKPPPSSKLPSLPSEEDDFANGSGNGSSYGNVNSGSDSAAVAEATRVSEQTKQGLIKLQQQSKTVFDGLLQKMEQADKDRARLEHAMREMHKMIQAGEAARSKLAQQNQILYQQVNDLKTQLSKEAAARNAMEARLSKLEQK